MKTYKTYEKLEMGPGVKKKKLAEMSQMLQLADKDF